MSGLCIGQIEAATCPPGQPPRHLTFLKFFVQIPPYPGQDAVQMPHTRVHSGDQMPPPQGYLTGTKTTEGRWKRLQWSNNKNWETLLAYLLRTKVSCKAAEIAATRSLNAQLFFVMQHTNRSIKKDPTYWDYYIMNISLTCIIAHLINSFLFYFTLCCCIESPV